MQKYDASKFAHIVYGVGGAEWQQTMQLSRSRRAGWLFLTNDTLPNPYDTLPGYWPAEAAALS
jgi:hypothetical protein